METIGSIVFSAFAAACASVAIWHEIRWRKRLHAWDRTKGTVLGVAEGRPIKTLFGGDAPSDGGPYPEIEFHWKGSARKFTSGYGESGIPRVGSEVDILFDPASGTAEYLSFTNRWLFTLIPIIFSALFFWMTFQT